MFSGRRHLAFFLFLNWKEVARMQTSLVGLHEGLGALVGDDHTSIDLLGTKSVRRKRKVLAGWRG